jgi:hypothetical protein
MNGHTCIQVHSVRDEKKKKKQEKSYYCIILGQSRGIQNYVGEERRGDFVSFFSKHHSFFFFLFWGEFHSISSLEDFVPSIKSTNIKLLKKHPLTTTTNYQLNSRTTTKLNSNNRQDARTKPSILVIVQSIVVCCRRKYPFLPSFRVYLDHDVLYKNSTNT